MRYKSIKKSKNLYRVPRPKRNFALNAYQGLSVCEHKNRLVVALTEGRDREFKSCHTINRSTAIRLIGFLSDYVNMVGATEATALRASIKASSNRITRAANELVGVAVGNEEI